MIENKFMCYQLAKTKTETIYELDLSAPYAAANTKEAVAELLATYVPADAALGTIAKFHSEDENGARFDWTYEWEQNEEEEKLFMLIAETYIDRIPNGEVVPEGKLEITSTAEVNVYDYATAQVVDENLIADNIKEDVEILGITGTYSGGGGGGGDIKNVQVRLITDDNLPNEPYSAYMAFDRGAVYMEQYALITPDTTDIVIDAIVKNTGTEISFLSDNALITVVSYTGDIEISDNRYIIFGDCIIHISIVTDGNT